MKALALLGLLGVLDRDAVARLLKLSLAPAAERPRGAARLSVKLHGTMVAQDERFSFALVDARAVFAGDTVEGRVVRGITRGCLLFDAEELCMRPRAGNRGNGDRPHFEAPPAVRHVALSDFMQWPQVRVVPVPAGFKIFSIPPGSLYAQLGIQNGDILRKVNGKPVDFSTLTLVRPGAVLKVELERNGALYALEGQLD